MPAPPAPPALPPSPNTALHREAQAFALDRAAFGRSFRACFPVHDGPLSRSLARLEDVAWQAHLAGLPAPFRHRHAGSDQAGPTSPPQNPS